MAERTHACPGGCGQQVAHARYACRRCWGRLPHDLQQPIKATHRRDLAAHAQAMADARRWYREHPLPGIASAPVQAASTSRHFWRSMIYACDLPGCGAEHVFLLEDGCEGPQVQSMQGVFDQRSLLAGRPVTVWWAAGAAGVARLVWWTAGAAGVARLVVPVPMIAGRCRSCAGGTRQGRFGPMDAGYLTHVRWSEDAEVDLTVEGEPGRPYFAYPSADDFERHGAQTCGRPVFPVEVTTDG